MPQRLLAVFCNQAQDTKFPTHACIQRLGRLIAATQMRGLGHLLKMCVTRKERKKKKRWDTTWTQYAWEKNILTHTRVDKKMCVWLLCLELVCILSVLVTLLHAYNLVTTDTHMLSSCLFIFSTPFPPSPFICECVWKVRVQLVGWSLGFHMTKHLCCSLQRED